MASLVISTELDTAILCRESGERSQDRSVDIVAEPRTRRSGIKRQYNRAMRGGRASNRSRWKTRVKIRSQPTSEITLEVARRSAAPREVLRDRNGKLLVEAAKVYWDAA